jgi:vacuolar-type H+-ATPase subunit C/Vma6
MENKKEIVTITFRLEKNLRETFKKMCKENDDDASKVLRRFIKEYVNRNK